MEPEEGGHDREPKATSVAGPAPSTPFWDGTHWWAPDRSAYWDEGRGWIIVGSPVTDETRSTGLRPTSPRDAWTGAMPDGHRPLTRLRDRGAIIIVALACISIVIYRSAILVILGLLVAGAWFSLINFFVRQRWR